MNLEFPIKSRQTNKHDLPNPSLLIRLHNNIVECLTLSKYEVNS